MYLFTTLSHPHGHWQLKILFGNHVGFLWETSILQVIRFVIKYTQVRRSVTDTSAKTQSLQQSQFSMKHAMTDCAVAAFHAFVEALTHENVR